MMMTRPFVMLPLVGLVACAANPAPGDPCGITPPPVTGWTASDEGAFTLQIPPGYTRVDARGIDSQVGVWEAPGKRLSYDLGFYSNTLQPDDVNAFPGLVVCQESDGPDTPRIVRWSPAQGGHAVGAHWPDLRRDGSGMTVSLTLEGAVEREEDQGEVLAIIRSVRIEMDGSAAPAAGGGATSPGGSPSAGAPQSPAGGDPGRVGYRAGGNEPFWTVTFGERTMEFMNLGVEDTVRAARPEPERLADGWRFPATADGQPFVVQIQDRRCSDSMSGRPFPHTVTVTARGQTFTGCGGDTASLLTGDEWRVTRLESAETVGAQRPTLLFALDGALTGNGGCNLFRSTYEITGEGIAIGPALATRRACADPEANAQETRFFALLEQVTRFDFAEDGSLRLLANDQPIIVAQR